jgi:hypothetical protein
LVFFMLATGVRIGEALAVVWSEVDWHAEYATTVCDFEHHQIIDILPSRRFVDVAGFLHEQPARWKKRIAFDALDMSNTYVAVYTVILPKAAQVVDSFHVISLANRAVPGARPESGIASVLGSTGLEVAVGTALERSLLRETATLLDGGRHQPGASLGIAVNCDRHCSCRYSDDTVGHRMGSRVPQESAGACAQATGKLFGAFTTEAPRDFLSGPRCGCSCG